MKKITAAIFSLALSVTTTQATPPDQKSTVVIDVRTPAEFNESHVKGALNIDWKGADFQDQVSKLDKTKSYKVYCRTGNRSGQAEKAMKSMGFKDVENLGALGEASRRLNIPCEGKTC